jgi:hypothetical protein
VDRTTRTIVVRGGAQIAKTESTTLNVWAYRTVFDPAPTMMVLPSQIMTRDFSHQRIEPMIENCPPLKAKLSERGTGPRTQGASTIRFRTYPGGFLKLAGSLSSSELSQLAVRDLHTSELDRFVTEVEIGEGDPVHLMKVRQRPSSTSTNAFWNVRRRFRVNRGSRSSTRLEARNTTIFPVSGAALSRNCSSRGLIGSVQYTGARAALKRVDSAHGSPRRAGGYRASLE